MFFLTTTDLFHLSLRKWLRKLFVILAREAYSRFSCQRTFAKFHSARRRPLTRVFCLLYVPTSAFIFIQTACWLWSMSYVICGQAYLFLSWHCETSQRFVDSSTTVTTAARVTCPGARSSCGHVTTWTWTCPRPSCGSTSGSSSSQSTTASRRAAPRYRSSHLYTQSLQSLKQRLNEGLRRFHNHREGPY